MAFDHLKKQNYHNTEVHGIVVNNNDLTKARRLQIRVSPIHDGIDDADLPWAVCGMDAGRGPLEASAYVAIPEVGADLLVKFQQGDPQNPIYVGGVSSSVTVPELFRVNYPARSGWQLKNGSYLYIDEVTNDLMLHHMKTTVLIDQTGQTTVNVNAAANVNVVGKTTLVTPELLVQCPKSTFTGTVDINGLLRPHAGILGEGDAVMDGYSLKLHKHPSAPPGPVSSAIP